MELTNKIIWNSYKSWLESNEILKDNLYKEIDKENKNVYMELIKLISADKKNLLIKLQDTSLNKAAIENKIAYEVGFRTGAKLIIELSREV
ncbi:DUF6809 family protein [Clostridium sulfidigenes]|uniref:DUF6809 family protein n=1 Tax=Clostridium sulfidigenes TaxID=318464 RepID=UPI003F8900C0